MQITTSSLPGGAVGAAYSQPLAATGGTPSYMWSVTTGALPAGLTLTAATGVISGTPTAPSAGSFTVTATDSASPAVTATQSLSIAIPVPITTTTLPNAIGGEAYSQTLAVTGGTAPYTWSISAGSLPAGLTLNAGTGAISGTPTTAGAFNFTVRVTDSSTPAASGTQALVITVDLPGTLAITMTSLPAGTRGTAYSQTLAATGGVAPYTWSISVGTLPAGLTLNASTGAISGTPTAAGTVNFTARVTDSATTPVTVTQALSIQINAAWLAGDVLSGYTIGAPTGGRADLRTSASYSGGQWTVMFTRALTTATATDDRQFDALAAGTLYPFAVAVLDNAGGANDATMTGQHTTPYTLGNEASAANLKAKLTAAVPTASPTDTNWGAAFTKPAGGGSAGTAIGAAVELRAAYDANNLYLLTIWSDATESNMKESWRFDGTTWARRSPKGTDGSWATIDADGSQWDEDRLAIWWDISVTGFAAMGCMALCHDHRMGTHTMGEKADLWHWKAARTHPAGFADDQRLNDGTWGGHAMAGRSDDTGTGIESGNTTGTPAQPASMAEGDPGANAAFLFRAPTGSKRAVTFANTGFSSGAVIPGYTIGAPTGGRADLRTSASYSGGQWTVMFTRALTTATATDDRQFDGLAGGTLYNFAVAVLDNAGGANDATMTGQHATPYTLGNEASAANLKARLAAAAPTASPTDTNWGAAFTKPAGGGSAGTAIGAAAELRAAYDANNLYLLTIWSDATESNMKESWRFDGTTWARRSPKGTDGSWATIDADGSQWDEDRLAIWWDIGVTGFPALGCMALCHDHRMGTHTLGEKADLWHWKAARTSPMGFSDDQRLNDGTWGGHAMAGRSDDTGTGIESGNTTGTPAQPASMAETDPGANAAFLFRAPTGSKRAVTFTP